MNMNDTLPVASGVTDQRLASLRSWNLGLTLLHFAQAAVILVLASSFAITVTSSIPAGPPGTAAPAPTALFDVPIGWAVAVFLGLAALDHLLTATMKLFRDRANRAQPVKFAEHAELSTVQHVTLSAMRISLPAGVS